MERPAISAVSVFVSRADHSVCGIRTNLRPATYVMPRESRRSPQTWVGVASRARKPVGSNTRRSADSSSPRPIAYHTVRVSASSKVGIHTSRELSRAFARLLHVQHKVAAGCPDAHAGKVGLENEDAFPVRRDANIADPHERGWAPEGVPDFDIGLRNPNLGSGSRFRRSTATQAAITARTVWAIVGRWRKSGHPPSFVARSTPALRAANRPAAVCNRVYRPSKPSPGHDLRATIIDG